MKLILIWVIGLISTADAGAAVRSRSSSHRAKTLSLDLDVRAPIRQHRSIIAPPLMETEPELSPKKQLREAVDGSRDLLRRTEAEKDVSPKIAGLLPYMPRPAPSGPEQSELDAAVISFSQGALPDLTNVDELGFFNYYLGRFFGHDKGGFSHDLYRMVGEFLKEHPDARKQRLPGVEIQEPNHIYSRPAELNTLIESINRNTSKVKSHLFKVDARLPRELRLKLAQKKGELDDYDEQYQRLNALRLDESLPPKSRAALAQLQADLVDAAAFQQAGVQKGLKSKDAQDVLAAFSQAINIREEFSIDRGFTGYENLLQSLKIRSPSRLESLERESGTIASIRRALKDASLVASGTKRRQMRQLSTVESVFRSCLGGDCSTRTYGMKALDPSYHYFTLQESANGKSDGHVTVVLGTASRESKRQRVALVDKIQNIKLIDLPVMLEAIRRSLAEAGYALALPVNVGDHNGLSNDHGTRSYVAQEMASLAESEAMTNFTPHPSPFEFEVGYSRAAAGLSVRLVKKLQPPAETSMTRIDPIRERSINGAGLAELLKDSYRLKFGSFDEKMRYIKIMEDFAENEFEQDPKFKAVIMSWINDSGQPLKLRFRAALSLLRASDKRRLPKLFNVFSFQERGNLLSNWLQTESLGYHIRNAAIHISALATGHEKLISKLVKDGRLEAREYLELTGNEPQGTTEFFRRVKASKENMRLRDLGEFVLKQPEYKNYSTIDEKIEAWAKDPAVPAVEKEVLAGLGSLGGKFFKKGIPETQKSELLGLWLLTDEGRSLIRDMSADRPSRTVERLDSVLGAMNSQDRVARFYELLGSSHRMHGYNFNLPSLTSADRAAVVDRLFLEDKDFPQDLKNNFHGDFLHIIRYHAEALSIVLKIKEQRHSMVSHLQHGFANGTIELDAILAKALPQMIKEFEYESPLPLIEKRLPSFAAREPEQAKELIDSVGPAFARIYNRRGLWSKVDWSSAGTWAIAEHAAKTADFNLASMILRQASVHHRTEPWIKLLKKSSFLKLSKPEPERDFKEFNLPLSEKILAVDHLKPDLIAARTAKSLFWFRLEPSGPRLVGTFPIPSLVKPKTSLVPNSLGHYFLPDKEHLWIVSEGTVLEQRKLPLPKVDRGDLAVSRGHSDGSALLRFVFKKYEDLGAKTFLSTQSELLDVTERSLEKAALLSDGKTLVTVHSGNLDHFVGGKIKSSIALTLEKGDWITKVAALPNGGLVAATRYGAVFQVEDEGRSIVRLEIPSGYLVHDQRATPLSGLSERAVAVSVGQSIFWYKEGRLIRTVTLDSNLLRGLDEELHVAGFQQQGKLVIMNAEGDYLNFRDGGVINQKFFEASWERPGLPK